MTILVPPDFRAVQRVTLLVLMYNATSYYCPRTVCVLLDWGGGISKQGVLFNDFLFLRLYTISIVNSMADESDTVF
jgi:hypothetical protein